tara:strand:- start:109 stop:279 length:171 start_codon:yes stop_codon:yes gene_type:complete
VEEKGGLTGKQRLLVFPFVNSAISKRCLIELAQIAGITEADQLPHLQTNNFYENCS